MYVDDLNRCLCFLFQHFQAGVFSEEDDEVGEELPVDEEEVVSDEDDDGNGGVGGRPYK